MIKELTWDSNFFKRKIGEFKFNTESPFQIKTAIKKAKRDGFKYIICKIQSQQTTLIRLLESLGFYLSDICMTWTVETDKFSYIKSKNKNSSIRKSIKVATAENIPMLKEMIKSLFLESRFYNDPFFSKEDADKLFQAWIENSVKGKAADMVYFIPYKGFVTCRKTSSKKGEIILFGVTKDFRSKGIGTTLTEEVIEWFKTFNVNSVCVRTQLKNINAMNFYRKLGFYIKGYDLVFAKILKEML